MAGDQPQDKHDRRREEYGDPADGQADVDPGHRPLYAWRLWTCRSLREPFDRSHKAIEGSPCPQEAYQRPADRSYHGHQSKRCREESPHWEARYHGGEKSGQPDERCSRSRKRPEVTDQSVPWFTTHDTP
jgi:hypothetical protein